jgi:hypothetical protein
MKIFTVDTEGWVEAHQSADSIESSLEYSDVSNHEYVVIDDAGFLYSWHDSSAAYCGFELQRTANKDPSLLERIQVNEASDSFKI